MARRSYARFGNADYGIWYRFAAVLVKPVTTALVKPDWRGCSVVEQHLPQQQPNGLPRPHPAIVARSISFAKRSSCIRARSRRSGLATGPSTDRSMPAWGRCSASCKVCLEVASLSRRCRLSGWQPARRSATCRRGAHGLMRVLLGWEPPAPTAPRLRRTCFSSFEDAFGPGTAHSRPFLSVSAHGRTGGRLVYTGSHPGRSKWEFGRSVS